jgi:two-component system response regulator CpxR
MPVISLFSGSYCNEKQVVQEIGSNRLSADFRQGGLAETSRLSNIPENRIERVFSDKNRYSTA